MFIRNIDLDQFNVRNNLAINRLCKLLYINDVISNSDSRDHLIKPQMNIHRTAITLFNFRLYQTILTIYSTSTLLGLS